jgi:hypothetical protein
VPASFSDRNSAMISLPWARMQIAGGLIGENHLRLRDEGARDADQLLLPAES